MLLCGGRWPISGRHSRDAILDARWLHVRCVSKVLILHVSGSHDLHRQAQRWDKPTIYSPSSVFTWKAQGEVVQSGTNQRRLLCMERGCRLVPG